MNGHSFVPAGMGPRQAAWYPAVVPVRYLGLSLVLLLALGCETLDRFRTNDHAVFHGTVTGDTADSFIRRGFPAETTLDLEFDPDMAQGPTAGSITTQSPDGADYFDHTELRVIESLEHDLLSQYDFPGAGRIRNYAYIARPDTGLLANRDVMVFLSLMEDGSIEVRVIAGSGDVSRGDVFGLFRAARTPR
jgi:hypothetical protein